MQAKERALIRKLKIRRAASKKSWRTRKQMLRLRPLMARIPEDLRQKLEIAAAWNGRSMNAEMTDRLRRSFDEPRFIDATASAVVKKIRALKDEPEVIQL